jgi:uncharacterized damage-inducible protein DinB
MGMPAVSTKPQSGESKEVRADHDRDNTGAIRSRSFRTATCTTYMSGNQKPRNTGFTFLNGEEKLMNLVETFFAVWEREAQKTAEMLKMLPAGQYNFRPDAGGRSLGELAWHLAELDAYVSFGVANGSFSENTKPPNIKRPMAIEALAPVYELIHKEARERLASLTVADLEKKMQFFGSTLTVSSLLWDVMLLHLIHHRGQLSLLIRLAGGVVPPIFGPTREQSPPKRTS